MSEERKKRKAERNQRGQSSSGRMRKIVIAVLVVAALAAAIYLGQRNRGHRLDAFAKCLAAKPVKMYGAYWCPHCEEQKEMFQASFKYVPYVECGVKGSRDEAQVCKDAGIKHFPTWEFADGERREGTLALPALGTKAGCDLP